MPSTIAGVAWIASPSSTVRTSWNSSAARRRLEPRVELTLDDLGQLEREILPRVKHAYLSAGTEPLMWKHFPALLEVFARARVPQFEMITKATLIDAELAARIVASA